MINSIVYTTKRENDGRFTALILKPKTSDVREMACFDSMIELRDMVQEEYGDISRISPKAFQTELEKRALHSPETVAMLQESYMGDISSHYLYGSPMRPMSASWARVPDAVYINADTGTGYHTYVAVPTELDQKVIDRYQLVFISKARPSGYRLATKQQSGDKCTACGEECSNLHSVSMGIFSTNVCIKCKRDILKNRRTLNAK